MRFSLIAIFNIDIVSVEKNQQWGARSKKNKESVLHRDSASS